MPTLPPPVRSPLRPLRRCCACAVLLAATVVLPGCYDAKTLTQTKLEAAARLRLEEVDLGMYRITLPRRPGSTFGGVVQFHAFGQVANRDLKEVQEEIAVAEAGVRHRMLLAIRNLRPADLEEPDLHSLRDAIAAVVNDGFAGDPVQSIGFYKMRFNVL